MFYLEVTMPDQEIQNAVIEHAQSDMAMAPDASSGQEMGLGGKFMEGLGRAFVEMAETITDRIIPMGAAELAQGLNTGNSFVPYGPTSEPIPEMVSADPPAPMEPPNVEPMQGAAIEPMQSYEASLDAYAARGGGDAQEQDMSR
jgi:hypothetical protein